MISQHMILPLGYFLSCEWDRIPAFGRCGGDELDITFQDITPAIANVQLRKIDGNTWI